MVLFFICSSMFANSIVDLYRTKGINAVEIELIKILQDVDYWKSVLSNEDLRFGYLSSFDYILLSNKSTQALDVYKRSNVNRFEKIFNTSIIVGEISGDKHFEGDLKTPVGAYEIVRKKELVDPFYGPLALVTSYPNLYDISKGKNGHGIWIHGVPTSSQREMYTQGCIAMENDSLLKLDDMIDYKSSMLLINEDNYIESNLDDIATILASIYAWQHSWKVNDLVKYMSFYDDSFLRLKGRGVKEDIFEFRRYKNIIFSRNEIKQIVFSDINIIPYPNIENKKLFKIQMHQDYWAPSFRSSDIKTLYVELKNGQIYILTES